MVGKLLRAVVVRLSLARTYPFCVFAFYVAGIPGIVNSKLIMAAAPITQYLNHTAHHDLVAMFTQEKRENSPEPLVDRTLTHNHRNGSLLLLGRAGPSRSPVSTRFGDYFDRKATRAEALPINHN